MTNEEVRERLHQLEQQKIVLDFFGTGSEAEKKRSDEILQEMQPLYEQLGGIFVSTKNANYIQPVVMYTLYKHPTDFPDEYVIRKFFITKRGYTPDKELYYRALNIKDCEDQMRFLHKLPRQEGDDPVIVCSYI